MLDNTGTVSDHWAHSVGPQRSPLSRVVVVVVVDIDFTQRRAAARSGEWAQHFSNASCCIINSSNAVTLTRSNSRFITSRD